MARRPPSPVPEQLALVALKRDGGAIGPELLAGESTEPGFTPEQPMAHYAPREKDGPPGLVAFVAWRIQQGWSKGASYRDPGGTICLWGPRVAQWSVWGALHEGAATGRGTPEDVARILRRLDGTAPRGRFALWHDARTTTLAQVLAALELVDMADAAEQARLRRFRK